MIAGAGALARPWCWRWGRLTAARRRRPRRPRAALRPRPPIAAAPSGVGAASARRRAPSMPRRWPRLRAGSYRRGGGAVRRGRRARSGERGAGDRSRVRARHGGAPRRGGGGPARRDREGSAALLRLREPGRSAGRGSGALGAARRDRRVPRKGLDALKDDRKGRFNLLLGLAGFERAVGRTAAARARLQPLLGAEAPPLSRAQRKRVLDLLDTIALDERAHALEDWPAPRRRRRRAPRRAGDRGGVSARRAGARTPGSSRSPSARSRRRARRRRVRDWRSPSTSPLRTPRPGARSGACWPRTAARWSSDRADEALRQALTLEPAWSDLRELRAQIARRRAVVSAPPPRAAPRPPSTRARSISRPRSGSTSAIRSAWAAICVEQALADSPGFVAAAVSLYALGGTVPQATIDALQNDGPGLWALARRRTQAGQGRQGRARRAKAGAPPTATCWSRPWIDRAVELDVQEARFARAAGPRGGRRPGGGARRISSPTSRASPPPSTWPRRARCAPGSARRPARRARGRRRPAPLPAPAGPHSPARGSTRRGAARARRDLRGGAAARPAGGDRPGPRIRRPAGPRRASATSWPLPAETAAP